MTQEVRVPTRKEISSLLIDTNPEVIIEVYKANGFYPPEDFVITPFDEMVFSCIYPYRHLPINVSSKIIKERIEEAFSSMNYEVRVEPHDVNNYFRVLRGDIPGVADSKGKATSANFLELRDRYNCLYLLRWAESTSREGYAFLIPDYKRSIQLAFAIMLLMDYDKSTISQELEGLEPQYFIVDMMIIDLIENGYTEELAKCMEDYLDLYEKDFPGNTQAGDFRSAVQNRQFLYTAIAPLAMYMNRAVAEVWLSAFRENRDAFITCRRDSYTIRSVRSFIKGGSGLANRYLSRIYPESAFGLGSFMIHLCFGLDTAGNSFVAMADRAQEFLWRMREDWLEGKVHINMMGLFVSNEELYALTNRLDQ